MDCDGTVTAATRRETLRGAIEDDLRLYSVVRLAVFVSGRVL